MLEYAMAGDDARVAYRTQGTGPPIVLLHGLTESSETWTAAARELARDHQVVGLDFRGHGASEKADLASLDTLVDDVVAVVTALQLEKPALIGHSLGGMVATACGERFATGPVINVDQPIRLRQFQAAIKSIEPVLRGGDFPAVMWSVACALGTGLLSTEQLEPLRAFRSRVAPAVVLSIWEPLFTLSEDELDGLSARVAAAVHAPYLSLHGSQPGAEYERWLREHIPRAQIEVWDGDGHWPHLAEPARFTARVRGFLADEA